MKMNITITKFLFNYGIVFNDSPKCIIIISAHSNLSLVALMAVVTIILVTG